MILCLKLGLWPLDKIICAKKADGGTMQLTNSGIAAPAANTYSREELSGNRIWPTKRQE